MQAALRVLNEEDRREDMRKIADADMNIDDYKVEPLTTECMTDFFTFETPQAEDIDEVLCHKPNTNNQVPNDVPEELPLNYYDNDDGFWDSYIQYKFERWEDGGMLVNRKSFIH